MSRLSVSLKASLAAQVATWPEERKHGLFCLPNGVEAFSLGALAPEGQVQVRSWLEENARFLLSLEWHSQNDWFDRFLRFYAIEISANECLYVSDSNGYFPSGEDGARLLAHSHMSSPNLLFLRRLFRTNGVAFGLILLPDVPSDVDSNIEDFGELLSLFSSGFSSGDLWETLKAKHPSVWNEAYENPAKPSHRLAHRLHDERIRAEIEQRESVELVTGNHPDEQSLLEAQRQATEALSLRSWANAEEKRRIVARYLGEVLHY